MEIKPNLTSGAVSGPLSAQSSGAGRKACAAGDTAVFGQVDSLENQLSGEPSVRSASIERAKELIAKPFWPSSEVLGKVSGLLADHLGEVSE